MALLVNYFLPEPFRGADYEGREGDGWDQEWE